MTLKNSRFPIASYFNWSHIINDNSIDKCISIIDKLYLNNRYRKDQPLFQTYDDLFLFDEFYLFKKTFIESCQLLLNNNKFNYSTFCFCYMDYNDNYKLLINNQKWHNHLPNSLVGVMYLKNPEYLIHEYSGTEFADKNLNSIGFIEPVPYSWHIFSADRMHRPGVIKTNNRRYVLTAVIKILE
jgi:hypothetical protein